MNHKYGYHVNRTGVDVLNAIERIRPAVIKGVEHDVGFWRDVRRIVPDAFVVGRLVVPTQEQDQYMHDPAGTGRAFAERILRLEASQVTYQGRRLFDAWESFNEVVPGTAPPEAKQMYDDFQVAFAEPIKRAGFEPVAMNFGTGNMLGEDFLNYFPGTLETYTYLGFHEYDWPDMWRLHKESIDQGEEGMWLTLRYRRTMREVRPVWGNRHTVIITECGMTQGVHPGRPDVGWRHQSHPIPEERYWQSLMWYNDELMKDNYVTGAQLFVVGAVWPWESFDHLGGIIDRLDEFQQSEPPSLEQKLIAKGDLLQVIQFNPNAALQKRIFADDFVPNSSEFEEEDQGVTYVAQRAEHLGTGEVRVYYVPKGFWDQVTYVVRDGDGGPVTYTYRGGPQER
jgi:hypothetical protein